MYTRNKKRIGEKGLTILELIISCIVFSLFLFAIYATMDIGLKSWQLGETKSDLHQKAEIVLNRVVRDFSATSHLSVQIDNDGDPDTLNEFICFESPMNTADNSFEMDKDTFGTPQWQAYILYYIYPRINVNPSAQERTLFRRLEPKASPSIYPSPLTSELMSLTTYINNTTGDNIRTIVKDIYSIDFDRRGNILLVNVYFQKHIRTNASVSFSTGGDGTIGTEVVKMSASVRSEN